MYITRVHFAKDQQVILDAACNKKQKRLRCTTSDPKKVTCKRCYRTREYRDAITPIKADNGQTHKA